MYFLYKDIERAMIQNWVILFKTSKKWFLFFLFFEVSKDKTVYNIFLGKK